MLREQGLGWILVKQLASVRRSLWASNTGYSIKELYVMVSAMNTWGLHWTHRASTGPRCKLLFHCGNSTIMKKGQLVARKSWLICLSYFVLHNTHYWPLFPWFQMQCFRSLAPDAKPLPVLSQHCDKCWPLFVVHLLVVFYLWSKFFYKFLWEVQHLTLQLFYMDVSSQALYKTFKATGW